MYVSLFISKILEYYLKKSIVGTLYKGQEICWINFLILQNINFILATDNVWHVFCMYKVFFHNLFISKRRIIKCLNNI